MNERSTDLSTISVLSNIYIYVSRLELPEWMSVFVFVLKIQVEYEYVASVRLLIP